MTLPTEANERSLEMPADDKVSGTGEILIKSWVAANQRVADLERDLNSAKRNAANSEIELSKWLLPADAQTGEKICVWYGDSLIQVECMGSGGVLSRVEIRTLGKSLSARA